MRHHVDLAAGHLKDFLQELGRQLAHDDEPVGEVRNLFHYQHLVGIWLAQNCVQRGNRRHFQPAQQMQDMPSSRAAEDSKLVLQAHHVDVVEVQELSGLLIRFHIILCERPSHAIGIVVSFLDVVDRERQQSS